MSLSFELIYVLLSMLVAVGIAVQTLMLKANGGRISNNSLLHLLSIIDLLWVVVSATAMYFLDFNALLISVPVVYCIYTLMSFFYGASQIDADNPPERPEDVVFSADYMRFSLSFACIFFLWAALLVIATLNDITNINSLLGWLGLMG